MCAAPWGVQYRGVYHDACGGYYEYCGGVQCRGGTQITKDFLPTVLNTPHGTQDIPHMHHDNPS